MSDSILVRGKQNFVSGMSTLVKGTIHPATYVLLGHSLKIENKIPNIDLDWEKISSIFTNLRIGETFSTCVEFCKNFTNIANDTVTNVANITNVTNDTVTKVANDTVAKVANDTITNIANVAKEAFFSAGRSIQELDLSATYGSVVNLFHGYSSEIGTAAVWVGGTILANAILKKAPVIRNFSNIRFITAGLFVASMTWLNPSEAYASILDSFQKHSFEIGVAATWGLSATFANMILKKMPGINHYPKMRWIIAPVVGFGIIQFGLNMKEIPFLPPKPEVFVNIARQVVVIGGSWKVANVVSQYLFRAVRLSSDTIAGFISDGCKQFEEVLQFLNLGQKPSEQNPPAPKKEATLPKEKIIKTENTPLVPKSEDDAVLESEDAIKEKTS
ncbi:MAG: hypothetical protein K940chlam6_00194 [Chlamydiae bacterium]|nr:hypothetical protein [Chlamydiota bacterium]